MTRDRREIREKTRAVLLAAIMIVSVFGGTMAFAGSAAATVQDFDGLTAGDVTAGTSSVNQEVTLQGLENDGTTATITISNDAGLDDSVITDASVDTANGHDVSGVNVQSNGDIVVNLGNSGGGTTANLVLTVTHDLSSTQDATVTYTATTDSGISQTATFDVSVAQPDYDSAVIPETNPDTLEVTFDEDVQADGTDTEVQSAFSISGASVSGASVNGFSEIKNGDTVVLDLSTNVASDDSSITVDYDGSSNGDPLSNNADAAVDALDFSSEPVTSDADPVITSAIVEDGDRDQIVITTSENVDASGLANDAFSLGDSQADVDEVDTASDGSTTIELSLDSAIEPGADLTGLSYDREIGDVVATADTDDELFAQGVTVSNNVVPSIQSAEVTSANPDRILVTYDGPVQSGDDGAVLGDFTVDTLTIDSDSNDDADFTAGTDSQVALPLAGTAQASEGDFTNLDYADGADGVESAAGVDARNPDTGNDVTNNVEPIITDATVQAGSPGEVQVTFSENVVANVSGSPDGNIDSAVTEAFEFKNSDVDLRIKNVESFGAPSDTITLNFGLEDGTDQEVSATDDLAGALSYNPTDPTDEAEKFPLTADGGTGAAVPQADNFDVTNNVDTDLSVAKVTTNGDELRVTFTNDVTQVGTDSEVVGDFTVGDSAIDLTDDSFAGIEDSDTVVFSGYTTSSLNSGTDLSGDLSTNGNGALEVAATNEALPSFTDVDIQNNIQPRIVDAEVTNANPSEIQVTYNEDITGSDGNAFEAFNLGSDAPEIDGQSTDGSTLTLSLAENVAQGDDLGTLTYNGGTDGQEIISGVDGSDAVGVDSDSADVVNNVGSNPVLQNVTVDDANENTDDDSTGEMLLVFNSDVDVTGDTPATSGLSFESNLTDVSVTIDSLSQPTEAPDDTVVATFSSDSGSVSSSIREDDDLSDASLEVTDASSVDISGVTNGNSIAETKTTDVSNEIAGELTDVGSVSIDAEILGVDRHHDASNTVTVTGFEDADDTKVIGDSVDIRIGGDTVGSVTAPRFDDTDELTVNPTTDDITEGNVEIDGSESTVDVADDSVSVSSTENVTLVHSAFDAEEGYQLVSQPMPGELVTTDGVSDVSYYDADGDSFDSYGEDGEVQNVHNGLFLNADTADATYGFAYDTDRGGQQINVGSVSMDEGWHIVGSNFDVQAAGTLETQPTIGSGIRSDAGIDLQTDLATQNGPESNALDVQLKSLPGTTLSNDDTVGADGVYYVFVFENDSRAIVLPEYNEA